MYGHSTFPRATTSEFNGDIPSPFPLSPLPSHLIIPHDHHHHHHHHHHQLGELDSVHSSGSSSGGGGGCSSFNSPSSMVSGGVCSSFNSPSSMVSGGGGGGGGCSSFNSPSSMVSCCNNSQKPCLLQRSISSHSLQRNNNNNGFHCHFTDFVDSESCPVRRVFSAGDLQGINYMVQHSNRSGSPLSNESNAIIEGMSQACRYSPEEKKERIERYRSKRNQRNFNKKIKYVCRKTLADSRPRIRGRFARNDEIENNSQVQWSQNSGEEDENDDDNWINFLDSFPPHLIP